MIETTSGSGTAWRGSPAHDIVSQSAMGAEMPLPPYRRPYPTKLFAEVTTRCNLRCATCVKQAPGQGLIDGDVSDETFARLAPAFPHLEALVLNGIGEPMLHRGLERFIAAARAAMPAGAWIGFQANGQLLGQRRAESLVRAGVDRIAISADAVRPDELKRLHGGARLGPIESAARCLHDAADLAGRPLSLGLEFVAMRSNLDQLPSSSTGPPAIASASSS